MSVRELVGQFLSFVETTRANSARSRNTRLSAIRSFFKYVAIHEPQLLHHCQKILAMPSKRYEKRTIDFLNRDEIEALVAAPDPQTWFGRRDRTLLLVAVQTGLRVSELINLTGGDVVLGPGAHVRCSGKGRKERSTPLRKDSVHALRTWLAERAGEDDEPLFVSNRGERLSRDAVERIVRKYVNVASDNCRTLKTKRVSPHVLRHSAAMGLLHTGVDCMVIALWLGHESVETTQMYIHADLRLKEQAMEKTKPIGSPGGRYRPNYQVDGIPRRALIMPTIPRPAVRTCKGPGHLRGIIRVSASIATADAGTASSSAARAGPQDSPRVPARTAPFAHPSTPTAASVRSR